MRSWQENLCRSNFVKDEFLKSLFDAYSHSSPPLCTSTQYQGLSDLGGKFSHAEGKPGVSGSRIFGSQF